MTITGEINLKHSMQLAFPEFYIGLVVSIIMIVVYIVVEKRIADINY